MKTFKEFDKERTHDLELIDAYISRLDKFDEEPIEHREEILKAIVNEDFFLYLSLLLSKLRAAYVDYTDWLEDIEYYEIAQVG